MNKNLNPSRRGARDPDTAPRGAALGPCPGWRASSEDARNPPARRGVRPRVSRDRTLACQRLRFEVTALGVRGLRPGIHLTSLNTGTENRGVHEKSYFSSSLRVCSLNIL